MFSALWLCRYFINYQDCWKVEKYQNKVRGKYPEYLNIFNNPQLIRDLLFTAEYGKC